MSAGNTQIKELMMEITAPLIKETDEMILCDAGDGGVTAVWYDKALCYGLVRNPDGKVTFTCTTFAAVRSVRLK